MTNSFESLSLISVPVLVRADPVMKERTYVLAQAVAETFQQLGLFKTDVVMRFRDKPESFEIYLGDLNDRGLAFAKGGFQRWLSNTDRWKADASLEKFSRTLLKAWDKSNP